MKRKKLLKTLAGLLDRDGRRQRQHRDELETLLAKLKKKEGELIPTTWQPLLLERSCWVSCDQQLQLSQGDELIVLTPYR